VDERGGRGLLTRGADPRGAWCRGEKEPYPQKAKKGRRKGRRKPGCNAPQVLRGTPSKNPERQRSRKRARTKKSPCRRPNYPQIGLNTGGAKKSKWRLDKVIVSAVTGTPGRLKQVRIEEGNAGGDGVPDAAQTKATCVENSATQKMRAKCLSKRRTKKNIASFGTDRGGSEKEVRGSC